MTNDKCVCFVCLCDFWDLHIPLHACASSPTSQTSLHQSVFEFEAAYLRLLLEHFRGIVDYEKFYSLPEDLFQHLCPDSLFLGSLVCQCVCMCVVALTVELNC